MSFGKFNKYFYYIILTFFFDLINDFLYGFNYLDIFIDVKIIDTKAQDYFSWHHFIHQIFNYLATFIFAFLFYRYEIKSSRSENENERNSFNPANQQIILIHNNAEDFNNNSYNFYILLIIIVMMIVVDELIYFYIYSLKDLDFWMVELIIITSINSKMFQIQIYEHQKFAVYLSFLPCLLKLTTIILSLFDDNKGNMPVLYNINKILIPIGIITYLILIILRSYINAKIKWFMDLKYFSPSQLLIYFGLIGTFISLIISIVSTFVKCNKNNDIHEHNIYDYICRIPFNATINTTDDKFLESFEFYFKTFAGKMSKNFTYKEILNEIIIIISGAVTFFFEKYFSILVIKYLTPVHLIFSFPIFYFFQKLVLVLYNWIKYDLTIKSKIKFILPKFILDMTGDFLSFFGFLIYLEMIELKCGNLHYNTKKNIIKRSFDESYGIEKQSPILNNDNEEEEDEDDEIDESDDNTLN